MKIVVVGGSGLIGSKVVSQLREHGHEVVAASPNSGVDTLTGVGLAEADLVGGEPVGRARLSAFLSSAPALAGGVT